MNIIVENLTRKPPEPDRDCRVLRPLGRLEYEVRDSAGRITTVKAQKEWNAGDSVRVSGDWIVGTAASFLTPKVYEV